MRRADSLDKARSVMMKSNLLIADNRLLAATLLSLESQSVIVSRALWAAGNRSNAVEMASWRSTNRVLQSCFDEVTDCLPLSLLGTDFSSN